MILSVEGSLFRHKLNFLPRNRPRVMLTFAKTYLYPTWKLHFDTRKDETWSPLR